MGSDRERLALHEAEHPPGLLRQPARPEAGGGSSVQEGEDLPLLEGETAACIEIRLRLPPLQADITSICLAGPHSPVLRMYLIQPPVPLLTPAGPESRFSVREIRNMHEHKPLLSAEGSTGSWAGSDPGPCSA